jgi:hypothetical protein
MREEAPPIQPYELNNPHEARCGFYEIRRIEVALIYWGKALIPFTLIVRPSQRLHNLFGFPRYNDNLREPTQVSNISPRQFFITLPATHPNPSPLASIVQAV